MKKELFLLFCQRIFLQFLICFFVNFAQNFTELLQTLTSFFREKRLTPVWSYNCKNTFWRLKTSEDGFIIGEDRNTEQKTATFFCINASNGKILWENKSLEEKWWLSFEIIHQGIILFHEYGSPDLPEPKKILAVDVRTGKTLWTNHDVKLLFTFSGNVYVVKQGFANQFFEIDIVSGEVVRDLGFDSSYVATLQGIAEEQQVSSNIFLPEYIDKTIFFNETEHQQMFKKIHSTNIVGLIEKFQSENFIAISFYENIHRNPFENDLTQHLYIFKPERTDFQIFYKEILINHATTALTGAFFVLNNLLCFVKEKKTLSAISLID